MRKIDLEAVSPEARAIGEHSGYPVEVDGQTWLLSWGGVDPMLDAFRDRMDDQARLDGEVNYLDVCEVGRLMFLANYRLSDPEVLQLLMAADRDGLTAAVMAAMFGDPSPHLTYTDWMLSSLYANGLDPEKIPARMVSHVLAYLVATKRAIPVEQYTDAGIASARFAEAKARFDRRQPQPADEPPCPIPEPTP